MTQAALRFTSLTRERDELASTAEEYLRSTSEDPFAGAELGWFGIGIPEDHGGSGGTLADLAPIVEAAGATCASTTVAWTTGVLGRMLVSHGVRSDLLPGIANGQVSVVLPVMDPTRAAARREFLVVGSPEPTLALVPRDGGVALFPAADIQLERVAALDPSRYLHRAGVKTEDQNAVLRGSHEWLRRATAQVLALDAAGTARTALSRLLTFASSRCQFGRPVGSFQAYKHRCASAFVSMKLAQSAAFRAAQEQDSGLALAAAWAGIPECTAVCGESIQLHGAIGFTWESGLHRYLRRSRFDEIMSADGDRLAMNVLSAYGVTFPAAPRTGPEGAVADDTWSCDTA